MATAGMLFLSYVERAARLPLEPPTPESLSPESLTWPGI
jgi:hypothetical protein